MKMSRRARRMERHHKRKKTSVAFNLVSLMDIFTILVFFLLVNSSEVAVLPNTKSVDLPESIAQEKPRETVVVMVTNESIVVQGQKIATVEDALALEGNIITPLKSELEAQFARAIRVREGEEADSVFREVNILADKAIPYRLLKKVMRTCTRAKYGNISLSVMQKAPGKG